MVLHSEITPSGARGQYGMMGSNLCLLHARRIPCPLYYHSGHCYLQLLTFHPGIKPLPQTQRKMGLGPMSLPSSQVTTTCKTLFHINSFVLNSGLQVLSIKHGSSNTSLYFLVQVKYHTVRLTFQSGYTIVSPWKENGSLPVVLHSCQHREQSLKY